MIKGYECIAEQHDPHLVILAVLICFWGSFTGSACRRARKDATAASILRGCLSSPPPAAPNPAILLAKLAELSPRARQGTKTAA
jgi:hypothetical protein